MTRNDRTRFTRRNALRLAGMSAAAAAFTIVLPGCAGTAADPVAGVYEGMLPCADCSGIRTAIYVRANGTYTRTSTYVGAEGKDGREAAFEEAGAWERLEGKRPVLRFTPAGEGGERWEAELRKGGMRLLDREGHPVEGPLAKFYELRKS